jgi:hypothetical protein
MGAAFAVACAIACLTLAATGTGERGLFIALRATARWSFLLFWLAYTGGALATLLGPVFRPLARSGRELGLSFAAAHFVHVGLVVWLYGIATKPPVPELSIILFSIALFWTYLLALLSIPHLSRVLGARIGPIIRTVGVEFIAFAFLVDFAKNPFRGGLRNLPLYLPFLILAATGPLLRLAAAARRLGRARRNILSGAA